MWFKFKGILSTEKRLIVTSVGFPIKAKPNYESIIIPGRSGTLTYFDNTFQSYEKKVIFLVNIDKIQEIFDWLNGYGNLEVSNEEDFVYEVNIKEGIETQYYGSQLVKVEIIFEVSPFKLLKIGQKIYEIQYPQATVQLENPTFVDSFPEIEIEGIQSDLTLSINQKNIKIQNLRGNIRIDSKLFLMIQDTNNISKNVIGDFPILSKGNNNIQIIGEYEKLKIKPNWRTL